MVPANKKRFMVSLTQSDRNKLDKVVKNLNLRHVSQLLEFLVSGDKKRLEWVMEGLEHVNDLF